MSSARVTSIEVLQTVAGALQKFRSESAGALDDLELELRRVLEWIHYDRKEYWTQEVRRSQDAQNQARLQLQQAKIMRQVADREPACADEKKALERATRRLETAHRKVDAVRHWRTAIDRAVDEFQRSRTQFAAWLDTDLSQAIAALSRMSASLDHYVSLSVPPDAMKPIAWPAGSEKTEAASAPSGEKKEAGP